VSPTVGQFVTETLAYDGGRQVTAYVPSATPEAIVFAGDGQSIASWGGVLEAADLPPTMPDRAGRVARRLVLAGRTPADGGVGIWALISGVLVGVPTRSVDR
jgi:hypothetical protein